MTDDDGILGADMPSDVTRLKEIERIRDGDMEFYLHSPELQKEYAGLVAGQMNDEVDVQTREAESNRYENARRLREIEEIRDQDMNAYFRSPALQREFEDLVKQQQLIERGD